MNANLMTKTAMFTPAVAAMRQRAEGATSPKDAVISPPAETETSKSKKKKKNKKRNSRASLTGSLNGVDDEEETRDDSAVPSPVPAVAVDEPTTNAAADLDWDWAKPTTDESSALQIDLPPPAPVSFGSPFDSFDNPVAANGSKAMASFETSATIMPPTAPPADAVSADFADLFASPAKASVTRPPPPPVPVDFIDPASMATPVAQASFDDIFSTAEVTQEEMAPPIAPALAFECAPVESSEPVDIDPVAPIEAPAMEAVSNSSPKPEVAAPVADIEQISVADDVPSSPAVVSGIDSPKEVTTHEEPQRLEETTVATDPITPTKEEFHLLVDPAVAGGDADVHATPLLPESSAPVYPSDDSKEVTTNSSSLPVDSDASSPPPAPVAARAHPSKHATGTTRIASKPSTNGSSHATAKPEVAKHSAPTKHAKVPHGTPSATTKPVRTTTASRTPPKPVAKPPAISPPTAKTGASKAPTLNRSLSGSAAERKPPAKSPTATTPTGTRSGGNSPIPARSPSADNEPKAPKKKLSASEIDAAGNRLYEQAMESKRRLEAKKALREEEFSFTPQVNPKSKKLDNGDAPNRFVLLHERAKEAQRKKEELREKLEKEKCTFKPQITNKAKKIASSSDKPRFENLYRNAREIQAKREEKKQELQKNDEELTFKPKIIATKSQVRSRPLYDEELVKQKRLELEQKKMEAQLQAKPKLVKKVKPQDGDNKIFDRLYQAGQQRAERLAKLKQEREEQEKASATFHPKVSAAAASAKTSNQPFHQRLFDKDHLKKVAAERELKKLEEEKRRYSFKPQVSEMPDSVKSKGTSDGGSTGKGSIFERLYQDKDRVKEKIEMSEELKIQKEMEECTFRPQIDAPPSTGGKGESATPIWERLLTIDKNQIAEERDRQKAQLELEACTFRPEISPTPGSLSPKRASSANIFERLSTSAGNTPVDEMKRRPSERKSMADGKRSPHNERGSMKGENAQRRALSVGHILKSSKLEATHENGNEIEVTPPEPRSGPGSKSKSFNGSSNAISTDSAENVARSLEIELSEPDVLTSQSKSILENYDTWAASLEEKMRNL